MSTRSLICQKIGDKYKTIYCHWDGYPQHMLDVLDKHYRGDELKEIENLKRIDKLLEHRLTALNTDGTIEDGLHLKDAEEGDNAQLLDYAHNTNAAYIYIYHDQIWHVVNTNNPLLEQEVSQ